MDDNFIAEPKIAETIMIPEATKQGYALAKDGDGVYINRPHQKRGVVQKGMIQTIKTSCDDVGVVVKSVLDGTNYNQNKNVYGIDGLSPTLSGLSRCGNEPKILGNIVNQDDVVGTITANAMQSFNHDNCHMLHHNLRIRKLTPLECWRLMGIKDEYFWRAKNSGVSNTQLYKQAGNAIVVNVLVAIFKKFVLGNGGK